MSVFIQSISILVFCLWTETTFPHKKHLRAQSSNNPPHTLFLPHFAKLQHKIIGTHPQDPKCLKNCIISQIWIWQLAYKLINGLPKSWNDIQHTDYVQGQSQFLHHPLPKAHTGVFAKQLSSDHNDFITVVTIINSPRVFYPLSCWGKHSLLGGCFSSWIIIDTKNQWYSTS